MPSLEAILIIATLVVSLIGLLLMGIMIAIYKFSQIRASHHNLSAVQQLFEPESQLHHQLTKLLESIITNNHQSFLEQTHKQIAPFAEQLKDLKNNQLEHLKTTIDNNTNQGINFGQSVKLLQAETQKLRDTFVNQHKRGKWGETQLKNLLEMSGMLQHCDFTLQPEIHQQQAYNGNPQKPDTIIHLPNNRHLIIDAKTPMDAFIQAQDTQDPTQRDKHLKDHYNCLKTHLNQLAKKDYSSLIYQRPTTTTTSSTPEFVVMFLPIESLYAEAFIAHRNIFDEGCQKGVIITTPSSLFALLKTVAYSWQQYHSTENNQKILQLSKQLIDYLKQFKGNLRDINTKLEQATKAYDKAHIILNKKIIPTQNQLLQLKDGITESTKPKS